MVYDSPFLKHISNIKLRELIEYPFVSKIPCHSKAVERAVRMINNSSRHDLDMILGMDFNSNKNFKYKYFFYYKITNFCTNINTFQSNFRYCSHTFTKF